MKIHLSDVIGNTPMIQLERIFPDIGFKFLAKLEGLNPGGSLKDRPANHIIHRGMQEGKINSSTVIIESSSGNMGIGLAQVCNYLGLRFICIIDSRTTNQNKRLLEVYGAEVILVDEPDPETGELVTARLNMVKKIQSKIKNCFWTNQYENINNSQSHYKTMDEIVKQINGKLDYLFIATSSCGTIRGCWEYIFNYKLSTNIIAVDMIGSKIFQEKEGLRIIPGIGSGNCPINRPPQEVFHRIIHVSNWECVLGCWQLVKREGLLAGGSSGALVSAVNRMRDELFTGANCVAIFPDRGERYLDTIYSKEWLSGSFDQSELQQLDKLNDQKPWETINIQTEYLYNE